MLQRKDEKRSELDGDSTRKDFRGAALTFDEFYDLVIIGMVGLSDALMIDEKPAHVEGMVNYKRVADNLGLIYEPTWIDDVGYALETASRQ